MANIANYRSQALLYSYKKVRITTADPVSGYIEGRDTSDQPFQITFTFFHSPFVQVPKVGEDWLITRLDNNWILHSRFEDGNEIHPAKELKGGDVRIAAPAHLLIDAQEIIMDFNKAAPSLAQLGTATIPGSAIFGTVSLDQISAGTISFNTSSLGTASIGTASIGTAFLGTASIDTASIGTASLGTASIGTATVNTIYITSAITAPTGLITAIPIGSLQAYAGATAPTGWLLCNGGTASTTGAYAALFSVIQYTYGGSAGTFYLPDMRGRVPMGAGTGSQQGVAGSAAITGGTALTARTAGQFGGDERMQTHTHIQDSHNHLQNAHGHSLGPGQSFGMHFGNLDGAFAVFKVGVSTINGGSYQGPYSADNTTATNQTTTAINQNTGSGLSQNLPPFVVLNWIIKT